MLCFTPFSHFDCAVPASGFRHVKKSRVRLMVLVANFALAACIGMVSADKAVALV